MDLCVAQRIRRVDGAAKGAPWLPCRRRAAAAAQPVLLRGGRSGQERRQLLRRHRGPAAAAIRPVQRRARRGAACVASRGGLRRRGARRQDRRALAFADVRAGRLGSHAAVRRRRGARAAAGGGRRPSRRRAGRPLAPRRLRGGRVGHPPRHAAVSAQLPGLVWPRRRARRPPRAYRCTGRRVHLAHAALPCEGGALPGVRIVSARSAHMHTWHMDRRLDLERKIWDGR
mmetsp:Transcript_2756/g.9071  ORF Transcript_2756/g.9071 Transcript_2756/m.9071 type:complete len:229 (+) Transcript_2756:586-1272(+)